MVISLTKTMITQLNNSYIDCSYTNTKTGNTSIVNIQTPNTKGNVVRNPFTIRTKDGYALKYDDKTGSVVFRITKQSLDYELIESTIITKYKNYFQDYTFNFKLLSTYVNDDPVFNYKPPTYRVSSQNIPLFEYSDIAEQKENIYILDTGLKDENSKPVYLVSYYGKDPKRCKLDLLSERFKHVVLDGDDDDNGEPYYDIKTTNGRYFSINNSVGIFGADETGQGGTPISNVVSISVNAEKVGAVIEEDTTVGLFTTYVVNQNDLKKISDTGKIYSDIIINTYSYPIKFEKTELLETNIVLGNTPLADIKGKRFKRAEPKIKIFSFNVPYLKDVESCKLLLPFNPEIILDYDIIRGKKINGFIQYEVSTNSSTLYIDNEYVEFYKDSIVIETVVPFKPTGDYKNFKETEKRMGKQVPTLLIKCLQEEKQKQFIQGIIEYPITGILKDELDLLNTELQKGVITNE